jgi:hypothetical protein
VSSQTWTARLFSWSFGANHFQPRPKQEEAIVIEAPLSDQRKQKFAEMLAAKVEQGYDIESQTETEAVLVTRGRRRMFRSSLEGKRQRLSIDEQERMIVRGL